MKKILSIVISLALLVGCMAVATVSASAERLARYTVLVLDVSGSMEDNGRLDSERKQLLSSVKRQQRIQAIRLPF